MSEADVALVAALQPQPDVDLVALFGEPTAWEHFREATAAMFDPEFVSAGIGTPGGDIHGVGFDGLRELWQEWLAPWRAYRTRILEVREVNGKVLVNVEDHGVAHGSDAEVSIQAGAVWTVSDGRVTCVEFYAGREPALRAALGP